jgi:uncharacterized protein
MRALYGLLRLKYRLVTVTYGKKTVRAYLADSFAKKMFGLMYRDGLEKGRGMLFVLGRESVAEAGVWMLNMRFSIDVVWMDAGGRIVDILEYAKPCTSMLGCRTYAPRSKAKYVLELNSGSARRLGMRIGKRIGVPGLGGGARP